jgi:hypothetical protein
MAVEGALCRALGTHSWKLIGPIVIMPNNTRRVALFCMRCDTWRYDSWSRKTGGLEAGRTYERAPAYKDYVKSHNRDGARLDIMGESKEISDASQHPRLRLLQKSDKRGGQRQASAKRRQAGASRPARRAAR